MGDWRRVQVIGTCGSTDTGKLRELLGCGFDDDRWDCLCSGGIGGLPNFGRERFDVVGNLGERGYDAEGVADHLRALVAACPSLSCKVHVGASYEESECVATVTADDGTVTVGEPEIDEVPELDNATMHANLAAALFGRGPWM